MERLKKPRNPLQLFFGVTGLIALSAYVNIVPPDSLLSILGFFLLLTVTLVLLGTYVFRKTRHALLIAMGISLYLVLRLLGLRQPFYAILLVASVIAIEYLWRDTTH